jgi:spore germination protein GerM
MVIDRVSFRLEGEPVELFGGHGIILDRPQTRQDFQFLRP